MPTSKKAISALCVVVAFVTACHSQKGTASSKAALGVQKPPFSLSVVPQTSHEEPFGGSIEMAHNKPREFFVVLTNVSPETQPVWEYWNSWGYQNISFELTTANGKKFVVSRNQEGFTRNFPSTFLIGPGEHQVYAIRLDEWWETHPSLPKVAETSITLKATYEVSPTAEATQYNVWTGPLESRSYKLTLRPMVTPFEFLPAKMYSAVMSLTRTRRKFWS